MLLKIARMYHKFVSNYHKQYVFTNILFPLVSTVCDIMMHLTIENQFGLLSMIDKTTTSKYENTI